MGGKEERADLCLCRPTSRSLLPGSHCFTHPLLEEGRAQRQKEDAVMWQEEESLRGQEEGQTPNAKQRAWQRGADSRSSYSRVPLLPPTGGEQRL